MSLRRKTLLSIAAVILVLGVGVYFTATDILMDSFSDLEMKNTINNLERAVNALKGNLEGLAGEVTDWAVWDDSYAFAQGEDPDYPAVNLLSNTFVNLRINLAIYLDREGEAFWCGQYDDSTGLQVPMPEALLALLVSPELRARLSKCDSALYGVVCSGRGPALLVAHPILTSEEQGPVAGWLLFGRFLDEAALRDLSQMIHLNLSFHRWNDQNASPDVADASLGMSRQYPRHFHTLDRDAIAGYALLDDLFGRPAFVLRVITPREIYSQGLAVIRYLVVALMAVVAILGLLILVILERGVLVRLAQLSGEVRRIGTSQDLSLRVPHQGKDELGSLAVEINRMLEALEKSGSELKRYSGELKQALEDLRLQEETLRSIFEATPDALSILDPEGKIVFANQAATAFSYTSNPVSAVGRSIFEFFPEREHGRLRQDLERLKRRGFLKNLEYRLPGLDGVDYILDLSASLMRDAADNPRFLVVGFRDVTESRLAQEALTRSEQRYRLLFERNLAGVFRTSMDGRILDCNDSMARMLGYPNRSRLIGVNSREFYDPSDMDLIQEELRRHGSMSHWEIRCHRRDGRPVWFLGSASLIIGEENEPLVVQGTMIDVTELKQTQRHEREMQLELMQQAKLASIGLLAAGVAHNLNVPLQALISHVELLKMTRPEPDTLDPVMEQAQRLREVIRNLLDRSRQEQDPTEQDLDLNRLLRQELDFLNADLTFKHLIEKRYEFDPDLPPLRGVYGDFSQSFMNLIKNAVDAMHGCPVRRLEVRTAREGNESILVEVNDTGCGIPPEHLPLLFEPFFTTKPGAEAARTGEPIGNGLGLPSVHQLLKKYGARFDIQSEVGKGTVFRILIPLQAVSRESSLEVSQDEWESVFGENAGEEVVTAG
ncbi:MAG: PAS domain S-box protein [Candidatus Zixiibacteriota bacterium]|nr:MAG: PAS domain S-box protein [candidate division Zixibacteria bacterium]